MSYQSDEGGQRKQCKKCGDWYDVLHNCEEDTGFASVTAPVFDGPQPKAPGYKEPLPHLNTENAGE